LPPGTVLNVGAFPDVDPSTFDGLGDIVGEDRSPFGPVYKIRPEPGGLTALAQLPEVQTIGFAYARKPANDLSRVRQGVAVDVIAPANYLNLDGHNVRVNVNDSGVDAAHPDLTNRVFTV